MATDVDFNSTLAVPTISGFTLSFKLASTSTGSNWTSPYLSTHTGVDDRDGSQFGLLVFGNGSVTAYGSTDKSASNAALVTVLGTWSVTAQNRYVLVATAITPTTGTYDVFINGIEVISDVAYTLGNGGTNGEFNWEVRNVAGGAGLYDDLQLTVIPAVIPPFQLSITPNGPNYHFTWNSRSGKAYDLVSATDLEMPIANWPVWDGKSNLAATAPFNTLIVVPGGGGIKRFFAVIEKEPVAVDTYAPFLAQVWGSGSTITLVFSEQMANATATDSANYAVVQNGGGSIPITSVALSPDGKTVTLTTGTPLAIGSSFSVSVNQLTDLAGNPIPAATVGNFQTWDNNATSVQVFILAGQSNMVGHGKSEDGLGNVPGAIGSLRYLAVNDTANYGHLLVDPGQPATSAWKTRNDVKVWWRDSDLTAPRAVMKGDLKIGYADFRTTSWFGPEYAFGWVMGEHFTDKPVLIIKTAWGGKSLHVDFRPPSAVAARGGVVGPYYTGMINYVRDCLNNLGSEFPEFAGMGYRIAGFGWHQGYNDRINGTYSADYEVNLVDLVHDLRAEFGNPSLPISITTTGMDPPASYTAVELAQLAVADPLKYPAFASNLRTTDTRPFWRVASVSPSSFGYHWNHNGESHYLNGKAMGEKMLELLGP
jgi:hypothetical protein